MSRKFNIGDRVKMTDKTREANSNTRSTQGVVKGYGKKYDWEILVKRDGLLGIERWHEDAWEHEERVTMFQAAGGPC